MAWKDRMVRKQLKANSSLELTDQTHIKAFGAVGGSATVKLQSDNGDDFAIDGEYSKAGLSLLPGENHEGSYTAITVTSGIVEIFISSSNIN